MSDVAAHARVSQKTVSRVVNGEPHVREEVRLRVNAAIRDLDYRPNAAARSLVTRRTRRIGVVALGTSLYGPLSALTALESVARADGYSLSIQRTDAAGRDEVQAAIDALLGEGVEGLVLSEPIQLQGPPLKVRSDVAVLTLGGVRLTDQEDEILVGGDQPTGGRQATEHLIGLGHRTVHHLAGPAAWVSSRLRHEGWESVLVEHGAPVPPIESGDWSPRSGYAAMTRMLEQSPAPTAVFVANDQMAIGAISALAAHGLSTPGDVSVVGFDDIDVSEYQLTPLTTVRQEFSHSALQGMNQLIQAIDGVVPEELHHRVPVSFVPRATTAPPLDPRTATSH
jgi:DNA-binding LacI/PurR family transcriptional regulator